MKTTLKLRQILLATLATSLSLPTLDAATGPVIFDQSNAVGNVDISATADPNESILVGAKVEGSASLENALTGTIDLDNGSSASNYNAYGNMFGVYVTGTEAGSALDTSDLQIVINSFGAHTSGGGATITGIATEESGAVLGDLRNTDITINDMIFYSSEALYGIDAKGSSIKSIDADSKITINAFDHSASITGSVNGIHAKTIGSFEGEIEINADMGVSKSNVFGLILEDSVDSAATNKIAGKITIINVGKESDTTGILFDNSNLNATDVTTTVTVNNSGGSTTGISLVDSTLSSIKSVINVTGTTANTFGIRSNPLNINEEYYIGTIDSQITLMANYTANANDTSYATGVLVRLNGFGDISSTNSITVNGYNAGVGLQLSIHPQDFTINSTGDGLISESGSIGGTISVNTTKTLLLDGSGVVSADQAHSKSTAAIKISEEGRNAPVREAILNVKDGLNASATVVSGENRSYGDAITFNTGILTLKADSALANITLVGDITGYNKSTGYNSTLNFYNGNYSVSSNYWYANNITLGNKTDRTISVIKLQDNTNFSITESLSFHVNSAAQHSQISVASGKSVDLSSLTQINVSVSADLLSQEYFAVYLIDGNITSSTSNEFTIILDDIDGFGTLDTIDIILDGVSYDYVEGGLTLQLGESNNDLILYRGPDHDLIIPEPSTATMSILALAGLLSRRRRRKSA